MSSTRTYSLRPRMLNPGMVKVAVLLGLAVGMMLCPSFGERWRDAQNLRAKESLLPAAPAAASAEAPIVTMMAAALPANDEDLFMGPQTPAGAVPEDITISVQGDDTQVTPGVLDLTVAVEEDGHLVQDMGKGRKVFYTVDARLQSTMADLVEAYEPPFASVVVMEPSTGRILAMVDYASIEELKGQPLSLRAEVPAASIFKIVSSAALLESGRVSTDTPVCYSGGRNRITRRHLRYDPERDRTCKDMTHALASSSNPVFARLTNRYLDATDLQRTADRFGFNQTLPFLWPAQSGTAKIPTDELELARCSAGFGHTHLSPLHAALMVSAVGNQGTMMAPVIVDRIEDSGESKYTWKPSVLAQVTSPEVAATIAEMMVGTTKEGTAAKYFRKANAQLRKIDVSGKTGSLNGEVAGEVWNFSWFVGFAPAVTPQVAVAVMVANEPRWKVKSTYLAREAFETYFAGVTVPAVASSDLP